MQNGNKELIARLNVKFCKYIFINGSLSKEQNEDLNNVINTASNIQEWHVPYELITKQIYETDVESIEGIPNSISQKLDNVKAIDPAKNDFVKDVKLSTVRHVHLAIVQKEYIDENLRAAKNTLKGIEKVKDSIYSDFIAILGIFTAITFATFGGLQLLGNVFGNIEDSVMEDIGSALMLGAVYLFGIYIILLALLIGIAKLKKDSYRPSGTMIYISVISFATIFLIGFSLTIHQNLQKFSTITYILNHLDIILITLIVIMWVIAIFLFYRKRRSFREESNSLAKVLTKK
ncbi:hypothetical protein [Limosilactobacillus reuteri]|uniref:hypothetical protein n=1 Tax=Limosilactobacillus reuteri TaxID=1598 RepID=UPI0021A8D167|nr:hypothetical protein [Limosilactobacillus reuteri]